MSPARIPCRAPNPAETRRPAAPAINTPINIGSEPVLELISACAATSPIARGAVEFDASRRFGANPLRRARAGLFKDEPRRIRDSSRSMRARSDERGMRTHQHDDPARDRKDRSEHEPDSENRDDSERSDPRRAAAKGSSDGAAFASTGIDRLPFVETEK